MSTKEASGYECSPVYDLRPSACQRDSLVGDESRRQSGLGDFTLHFSGVLASLSWLPTHIRLPPSKCFSVAGASPGSFVLGEFRRCLTIEHQEPVAFSKTLETFSSQAFHRSAWARFCP